MLASATSGYTAPDSWGPGDSVPLIGTWTADTLKLGDRAVHETLTLNGDGTYSVEARFSDTNEFVAGGSGTFTYSSDTITYMWNQGKVATETYSIDSELKRLTIVSQGHAPKVWERELDATSF
jgi:hypothetical protein